MLVVPTLEPGIEHGPRHGNIGARELDPDCVSDHAVVPVAADDPRRDKLPARAAALDCCGHGVGPRLQADQSGRAGNAASVRLEIGREHRLGDLLGNPQLEAVTGPGEIQRELGDGLTVGAKARSAGPYSRCDQPQ